MNMKMLSMGAFNAQLQRVSLERDTTQPGFHQRVES